MRGYGQAFPSLGHLGRADKPRVQVGSSHLINSICLGDGNVTFNCYGGYKIAAINVVKYDKGIGVMDATCF